MKTKIIPSRKFFFCPASDYLNQHNETGSHGQISYQFLRHLAMKPSTQSIYAVVMLSMPVTRIAKTTFNILIKKKGGKPSLRDFDSLYFYVVSFFKFYGRIEYKDADVVHHIIPFFFGRTFNLFFLFKNKTKKYVIGPIVSPHLNEKLIADEEYVFIENKPLLTRLLEKLLKISKKIFLGIFSGILSYLSLKTLQNADILLFSDNNSLNHHKKYIKKTQITAIIDTGVDVTVFKPGKKLIKKKKNDGINILFVGRLTKRKGCEYLVRALHEAKMKKKDLKIHCDILGFGPLKDDIVKLVGELNLINNITFLEGVKNEELVKYYHATDIICIPALSDTFTVIKEGMASGKPIIVTDVSSHAERVQPGVDGYIVPPGDSHAIAEIFLKLAKDPTILNLLSHNAPKSSYRYDWNNILDKYVQVLSE